MREKEGCVARGGVKCNTTVKNKPCGTCLEGSKYVRRKLARWGDPNPEVKGHYRNGIKGTGIKKYPWKRNLDEKIILRLRNGSVIQPKITTVPRKPKPKRYRTRRRRKGENTDNSGKI